jgi:hypothetical protein
MNVRANATADAARFTVGGGTDFVAGLEGGVGGTSRRTVDQRCVPLAGRYRCGVNTASRRYSKFEGNDARPARR